MALQILLEVFDLLFSLAGYQFAVHVAALELHVDYCLDVVVLVDALADHIDEVNAVLDALLTDLVLLLEPFFAHLNLPDLHLCQP